MNHILVKNWNETVKPNDTVYYLGDFCFGSPADWLRQLNGQIAFILGSHDHRLHGVPFKFYDVISIGGLEFYLVHNPFHVPEDWAGWVIHGHSHNHHPFIERRRVNVSAEVINYKPISLAKIVEVTECPLALN